MSAKWLTEIRGNVPTRARLLLGLLPIAGLLAAWFVCTLGDPEQRFISPAILPSPLEVIRSVPELLTRRDLVSNTMVSLRRVALGYLLALVVVLPVGTLMGAFGSLGALCGPLATASGYIPIATLVPLTMSWFGTGETQKVMFLAMAFGIALVPLVVKAIDSVSDVYLRTAYTLGATKWQAFRRVLVPIALPDLWHGMRLSFGVGWTYLVLAEVVVMADGLGFLVEMSRRRGPREHIYLVIIVITIIAWASDLLWERAGRLIFPYRRRAA